MEVRRRRRMPTRTNNREAHIMFKRLPPTSTSHGLQQLIHSFSLQCSSPNCFVNDSTRTGYKRHDLLYTRPRLTRNNACPEWREPCRTMSMIDASMMLIGLQRETLALTLFGMYNRKVVRLANPLQLAVRKQRLDIYSSTISRTTQRGGHLSGRPTKLIVG
ncbi:hypothetical protein IQ06DRAFT_114603 [Phaeosphaeriaceae sp. SRC1lsM3a]|nr:hypothetical protein IQ06DRAFT_114603 [Stagonospora sp. SRC1lsM3a]